MKTKFTFEQVCKLVESDYPDLKEDFNVLLDLLILFSPLCFSNPATGTIATIGILADLLAVKDGIFKVGERLLTKITGSSKDPIDRYRRMELAYVLICYSAFFDSLEKAIPEIMDKLKLKQSEKQWLSQSALDKLNETGNAGINEQELPETIRKELDLPHPASSSLRVQSNQLLPLYEELSKGFEVFLEDFAIWDNSGNTEKHEINEALKKLPKQAYERFEAQYYSLSQKYNEFFVWANLHEQKETQAKIETLSTYLQNHIELINSQESSVDVGMKRLNDLIALIPDVIDSLQADRAIQELKNCYESRIEEPVVTDAIDPNSSESELIYPKKSEIFIPQSFQAIQYSGKSLEDDASWINVPIRDSLGSFLLAYFSSPYSTTSPLVILGHPGSGKSLLTSIIAARFSTSPYTPIRVALREVGADSEIAVQVEEQIKKDTTREVTWAKLTDTFNEKPSLVILDGYDELLQASGKVYAGYLGKVQKFQQTETQLGRQPVRAIVTSRVTLIDKADIPQGTTIIRLQSFDEKKREKWAAIWNRINKQYFEQTAVNEFIVPQSKKLVELAEQPLLLLMLAIYDSESNQLQSAQELDQTVLYDRLLRRFIKRELEKDNVFFDLPQEERNKQIEYEMERLGTVALGMFNRRKVQIKISELSQDLSFFNLERKFEHTSGTTLSEGNLLLGSFFFVHESKSGNVSESTSGNLRDAAFEFLHNTFGEFLTAEFILRKVVKVCGTLNKLQSPGLESVYSETLKRTDEFPTVCLAFAPFFARPVVISMMREWLKHKLESENLKNEDFLKEFDAIIQSEIERLLTKSQLSNVLMGTLDNPFPSFPLVGHISIYSLNLILLRTLLSSNDYIFDEDKISLYPDGVRAWDRLTFLWRSWFSIENLNGLAAIFSSERNINKIQMRIKDTFGTPISKNRLDTTLNVSQALSDNILTGLAGIQKYDAYTSNPTDLDNYKHKLEMKSDELDTEFLVKELRSIEMSADCTNLLEYLPRIKRVLEIDMDMFTNLEKRALLIEKSVHVAFSILGQEIAIDIFDTFYLRYAHNDEGKCPYNLDVLGIKLGLEIEHEEFLIWRYKRLFKTDKHENIPFPLIVESIKLLRKFGYTKFLDYNNQNNFRSEKKSHKLASKKSIDSVKFGISSLQYWYQRIFHGGFTFQNLPTEIVIEAIKLAREFRDKEFLISFYQYYLEEGYTSTNFESELIIEFIKLARELNDNESLSSLYRNEKDYIKVQKIRTSLNHLPLELLFEFIGLAREVNDREFLEFLFKSNLHGGRIFYYLSIERFIELIELVEEFDNPEARLIYEHYLRSPSFDIHSLSLRRIRSLKRIAFKLGDENMVRQINMIVQELVD